MKRLTTILASTLVLSLSASACSDDDASVDTDGVETADSSNSDDSAADATDEGTNDSDNSDSTDASSDSTSDDTGGDTSDEGGSDIEPVDLGAAGNYVILAKSGISTTGATAITGDIGLSPAEATYITGFGLDAPPTESSSSALITGKVWASDYDVPTPANLTTAVSDMESAYTDAAGRTMPDHTELGAGNIDGMTLRPGLYKWGTGVNIPASVTLEGGSTDVWIFQIGQDLLLGNGASISLSGGAEAKNVFWQVAGQVTLGTTSSFQGIVLSQTLIEFNTGATMTGRALAQTAVTLDASVITSP